MSATLHCSRCGNEFEAQRSDAQFCPPCRMERARERAKVYDLKHKDTCPDCGGEMVRKAKRCLRCDNKARRKWYIGESNPNWREGRSRSNGYISVRIKAGSPGKGKGAFYRGEHIVVWETANGPLPKGWVVHHLNGVKDDNRLENLAGMPRQQHHSKPREALKPYEQRIRHLEGKLARCKTLRDRVPAE